MKEIAIVGCGASGLFMLKNLIERGDESVSISIFESAKATGAGMPYSPRGADPGHVTNVSGNEIPALPSGLVDWVSDHQQEIREKYEVPVNTLTDYQVVPRLLFGDYLHAQLQSVITEARQKKIEVRLYHEVTVSDIQDLPSVEKVAVIAGPATLKFDHVVICTGHVWPVKYQGKIPGYFDSPYPPEKLALKFNHQIAITGSSLTAIDAIQTLAHANGNFVDESKHGKKFVAHKDAEDFGIVLYSKHGLFPSMRFHLSDSHLSEKNTVSKRALETHREENGGFISLDHVFEKDFKAPVRKKDPAFYDGIKQMDLETFVDTMMQQREKSDAMQLLKAEYKEAEQSIKEHKSIYWKEALAILSFAMNYPAKYFSAEDHLRHRKILMPLISIVIAFSPQISAEQLIALYEAGKLKIIASGEDGNAIPEPAGGVTYTYKDPESKIHHDRYKTYVDCTGQKHLNIKDFPFRGLVKDGTVQSARLAFKAYAKGADHQSTKPDEVELIDGKFYLKVPGIAIDDLFQPTNAAGIGNPRIHIMAVPFIGGFNPDYSGLDFCMETSKIIAGVIVK